MSSTDVVNFRLRHNKSIERGIVFECLRSAADLLGLRGGVYVGFGSVWFVDFHLAHRELSINTMISLEEDDIVFSRARFNKPYRTVEVIHGSSHDTWESLFSREDLTSYPWVVWLDYDKAMTPERLSELCDLVTRLPRNSALITTFNGEHYYKVANRPKYLRDIFGEDLVPGDLKPEDCRDDALRSLLARFTLERLAGAAQTFGRKGGFVPAFSVSYRDRTPMVTVGGFLPSDEEATHVRELVNAAGWRGFVERPIATPSLTFKEVSALLGALPTSERFGRDEVQELGFDLQEHQLDAFIAHYLQYPSYAEIAP